MSAARPSLPVRPQEVRLMLTCLCDAFYGEVGIATVRVLEAAGMRVHFDERQTCCGQPPFNSGDWKAAAPVARRTLDLFPADSLPVVVPSGSCTAMVREGYPMMLGEVPLPPTFELAEFLVDVLGVTAWPPSGECPSLPRRRVAIHRACHGRAIGLADQQARLVASLPFVEIVEFAQPEQCCGFGGAFAANHSAVSRGIGLEKLRNVLDSGAEVLVSGDMGCLLHLNSLIEREKLPLKTAHFAQLLAEALP